MVTKEEYLTRIKKYFNLGRLFDIHHTKSVIDAPSKKENKFTEKGKCLVSKVKATNQLKSSINKAIKLIGGLEKSFKKSDNVLLFPNYNSDDPYPATTDPKFLKAVIELLQEFGIKKITIGCCAGIHWLPTRNAIGKLGVLKLADKLKIDVICFEEKDWVKVKLNSDVVRDLSFAEDVFKFDKIIYLPCMKTHRRAKFTMSLKLTVGLMCLKHRALFLHTRNIEKIIADINKVVYPDLIIMDARKIFVTGGPDKGEVEDLGLIFASGDRVAIDIIGLYHLLKYRGRDNLLDKPKAEDYDQIKRAIEIGVGVRNRSEIKLVNG